MKKLIGFATQFYTLWDYEAISEYKTDAYGNHHCTGTKHCFYYIKNISTNVDKVKSLYPGVDIDENLRGKTNSFSNFTRQDLPENFFWAGKYTGKLIDEILIYDFQYCLWSVANYGGKTSQYIKRHPIYLAYLEAQENAKQGEINAHKLLKEGDEVELEFVRNGYNADENYTECWTEARFEDVELCVNCKGVKPVQGMYPYLMPVINGKALRTKGKKLKVKVVEVIETGLFGGIVKQFIKVA